MLVEEWSHPKEKVQSTVIGQEKDSGVDHHFSVTGARLRGGRFFAHFDEVVDILLVDAGRDFGVG